MEIIVGKTAGFCFGVENAVTKTEKQLQEEKEVYCLGELVHNTQVTDSLVKMGAKFIDNIEDAKGKVIIRAHGIPKETYSKAEKLNLNLVDLTCPKVLHIHKIASEYESKGYFIIITGKASHPETIGTVSYCGDNYYIIEKEEDVENAIEKYNNSKCTRLLVISQTTYSMDKFEHIIEKLKNKINEEEIEIKNTICSATKERQEETKEIAKQVQIMIIVGSKHSSNSSKLYEIASKYCKDVIFIETETDLDLNILKNKKTVGIMAGASTPKNSIQKIIEKLQKVC